jgi:hypothetical protein
LHARLNDPKDNRRTVADGVRVDERCIAESWIASELFDRLPQSHLACMPKQLHRSFVCQHLKLRSLFNASSLKFPTDAWSREGYRMRFICEKKSLQDREYILYFEVNAVAIIPRLNEYQRISVGLVLKVYMSE